LDPAGGEPVPPAPAGVFTRARTAEGVLVHPPSAVSGPGVPP